MCGIAGLIHRGNTSKVGFELQGTLQALKHRGEDSTGYALYGKTDGQNFIMLNGQLRAMGTQVGSGFDLDGTAVIRIGRGAGSGWDSQYYEGYMDGIRFCKGQSAYTPHFNPYGSQKNIVHNRGGAVTDAGLASANTHAIQMGRAGIGSSGNGGYATNANTYCLDFDGTADYLLHYNGLPDDTDEDGRPDYLDNDNL